jgi:hypothetical protein
MDTNPGSAPDRQAWMPIRIRQNDADPTGSSTLNSIFELFLLATDQRYLIRVEKI